MKRIWICLLALICLCGTALAEASHVYDPSGIFSAQETAQLESAAQSIRETYGVDLLLAIMDEDISMEAEDYAPELYANLRGQDAQEDYGAFAVDLHGRTYGFDAEGRLGRAMNDYGARSVEKLLLRYLADGDYLGAMNAWIDLAERLCNPATAPSAGVRRQPLSPLEFAGKYIAFILIGAIVIAGIVVGVMISKLKTAKFQSAANAYVVDNSLELRTATEHFLYETVTRRKIERNPPNNGGGASHSSSSSCHGGGHF